MVGFIESMTVTRTFGLKNEYFPDANSELFALGMSNLVGSFLGCYPTFGSLPRSRVLYNSGGQTVLVGAMAGMFVLFLVIALKSVLQYLPLTVLAAVVFAAAINLIEYGEIFYLIRMNVSLNIYNH